LISVFFSFDLTRFAPEVRSARTWL